MPTPAASSTAPRLRSARSAWASTPPSTISPVAGSRPSWPEQNTRSPLAMPWLYGPMAAGAPFGRDGLAGHGVRSSCPVRMVVAMIDGGPSPSRRDRAGCDGRLGQPRQLPEPLRAKDRASTGSVRTRSARRPRVSVRVSARLTPTSPGATRSAAGSRSLAEASTPARAIRSVARQAVAQLLRQVLRRHPDRPIARAADPIEHREHVRRPHRDRRRHQQDPRVPVHALERREALAPALDERRARRAGRTARRSRSRPPRAGDARSRARRPMPRARHRRRRPRPTSRHRARRRPGCASRDGPQGQAWPGVRVRRPTAARAAAIARRTRLSATGPASNPVTCSVSCRARRPAPSSAGRRARAARTPSGARGTRRHADRRRRASG